MSTTLSAPVGSFETLHATSASSVANALQDWLCNYIGQIFGIATDQVDPSIKFDRFGLDSSAAVGMVGDLGTWLGCELDPALTYDFPTIAELATELAGRDEIRAAVLSLT